MLLRYPGGKSRGALAARLVSIIEGRGCEKFCEPFFGAGGITFSLLEKGAIKQLAINDFDISISRLWNAVVKRPKQLQQAVKAFHPSVEAFERAKKKVLEGTGSALATIVVNRLSHGGRGVMAGPQGRHDQKGKYKIDCRWNPNRLCEEIIKAHELLNSVDLFWKRCHCQTYTKFLSKQFENYLFYLDPPYYRQGEALYRCGFSHNDHLELAARLTMCKSDWVLSYDNTPFVRHVYGPRQIQAMSHAGNGGRKQEDRELIITSFTPRV